VEASRRGSVTRGQTLVWNRPPWIEPDSPQHFEVLFEDPYLLAVSKPGGLPTLPFGGFMENTLLRLVQRQTGVLAESLLPGIPTPPPPWSSGIMGLAGIFGLGL
jgi:23S rRNA-/tRNA-specific pseudouridylate synthase